MSDSIPETPNQNPQSEDSHFVEGSLIPDIYTVAFRADEVDPLQAQVNNSERVFTRRQKAARFISGVGLAAVCVLPTADLALSDIAFAKAYEETVERIDLTSNAAERAAETGVMGGLIIGESVLLGAAISKNKKLQTAFGEFDEYQTEKRKQMRPARRAVSTIANLPFAALGKVSSLVEKVGHRIEKSKTKAGRITGQVLVDAAQTNAMGTSNVILHETMSGKPPSLKRMTYFGGVIATSWLGVAEGIRQVYREIPAVRPPLAFIGRTFELLTSMDVLHPHRTPTATFALGAAAVFLAKTGWNISKFHEEKELAAEQTQQI